MLELTCINLALDADARYFVKNEFVEVVFATSAGELISREGPNRYCVGDALITGSTGDKWSVSRARFESKYEPIVQYGTGRDGQYRARQIAVLGKQLMEPFCAARSAGGDMLKGGYCNTPQVITGLLKTPVFSRFTECSQINLKHDDLKRHVARYVVITQ